MKLIHYLGLPLLIFSAIVLQRTGIGEATVAGVHPDIVMAVVAGIGAYRGREVGALSGFFAGILVDSFTTTPFGLSALVLTVVGYLAGELERFGPDKPVSMRMLTIGAVSLVGQVLYFLVLFLLGLEDPFRAIALEEIVIVAGVNLFISPLVVGAVRLAFGPVRSEVPNRR